MLHDAHDATVLAGPARHKHEQQFDLKLIHRWRRNVWRIFASQGFKPAEIIAALVLAAVAGFGTDAAVLSEVTGSSEGYVRKVLKRLRREKVLVGQTLRTGWAHDEESGWCAEVLDAGIAAGIFTRGIDLKRSIAQKARAPETRARGPRRRRSVIASGAVFTPKMRKSDPSYGLPEWREKSR